MNKFKKKIITIGGGGFTHKTDEKLDQFVLSQCEKENFKISFSLMGELAKRLRKSDMHIEALSLSDAEHRIGVSILIEIIEKLQDVDGKLGYYNLAPIVEKTFNIMGLTKYSSVFQSEGEALEGMSQL